MDSTFSAGALSSGIQNSEYPRGRIPTNRSRDQIQRLSENKIYSMNVRAKNVIDSALQIFDQISDETTEQQDGSGDKTAVEQWFKNDPDLCDAVSEYFEEVENLSLIHI